VELIRQYVRNILLEGIKSSEMQSLCLYKAEARVPIGLEFRYGHQYFLFRPEFVDIVLRYGKRGDYKALSNSSALLGSIKVAPPPERHGRCNDVSGVVELSTARPGWGPTMYDIVMTDQPNGIMPDRREVSKEAYKVWDYYYRKRKDVDREGLDWKYAQWTEEKDDDCDWGSQGQWSDLYGELDKYMYDRQSDDGKHLLPMDPVDVKSSVDFVDFLADPTNHTYNLTSGPISQSDIDAALKRGDNAVQKMSDAGIPVDDHTWWRELGRAFYRNQIKRGG